MNNRFPLLSTIAAVLRVGGWIVVAIGAITFLISLFNHFAMAGLGAGILIALFGFGAVAYGELIGVAFAIEENTRRAADNTNAAKVNERASPVQPV